MEERRHREDLKTLSVRVAAVVDADGPGPLGEVREVYFGNGDLQMQNVSADDRRHTILMSRRQPMIFHVSLQEAEDGWIVAEVPALPGCVSQGKDEREALENVKEAITAWMWAEDQKAAKGLSEGQTQVVVSV
jgi:predicted RNase H-like HicB family nuclease